MVGFKGQIIKGFHMLDYTQLGFYSSGFDRADHLRADRNGAMPKSNAKTMILWRGKPLLDQNDFALVFVGADHAILSDTTTPPIYLGQQDGMDYFAHDISDWQPEELTDPQEDVFLDDQSEHHPAMPPHYRFNDLRFVMASLSPQDGELAATAVKHRIIRALIPSSSCWSPMAIKPCWGDLRIGPKKCIPVWQVSSNPAKP